MQGDLPLYVQLKNNLLGAINNDLIEGDKLPSEKQLMDIYHVSRTTVRRALDELEVEGKIYRKQGVGSFVKGTENKRLLGKYSGFSDKMKHMGYDIEYHLLNSAIKTAGNQVSKHLNISPDSKVFYMERLALHNDTPINLTLTYIPYSYVEGIEGYDFSQLSLYSCLEKEFDIYVKRISREISAISADYEISNRLEVREGLPILMFVGDVDAIKREQLIRIEYFKTYYRTDNMTFYVEENIDGN